MNDFKDHYEFDLNQLLKDAGEHLERHVASIVGNQAYETKVVIGYPFKEILDEVAERKAELLVLGSRGHRQKDSRKTGVFAAKCIRKAPVDMLLVLEQQDGPFHTIVVCIDFSETSKRAAQRAVAIARQDGASLELLHASATPFLPDGSALGPSVFMTPLDTAPMIEASTKQLQGWADELAGDVPDKLDIKITVKEGISTGNVLVNHLHDTKADLAVLGTRGRTGL